MNIHQAVTAVKALTSKTIEVANSLTDENGKLITKIKTPEQYESLSNSQHELLRHANTLVEVIAEMRKQYTDEINSIHAKVNATK